VKDQRKCFKKREKGQEGPMTDERFTLLSRTKFDFKPSETAKVRAQEKKKLAKVEKNMAKKNGAESLKSSSVNTGTPARTKDVECVERAVPAAKTTPGTGKEAISLGEIPAKKTPQAASKLPSAITPGSRKKSGKPTYLDMTHDAIVSLKDRTGSSVPAISKWILANHEHAAAASANLFKNRLGKSVKEGVKEGRFVKVKSSFKINPDWIKKQKAATKAKEAARKKAEKQRQKELEKAKHQVKADAEKKKSEELKAKKKAEEENKEKEKILTPEELQAKKAARKRKEEAEARKTYIEQQLRKRRYPIEDTRLHKENKEWGVKPREHVKKRPALPHSLTCLIPPHLRESNPKKYRGSAANASASGNGSLLGGNHERGLITDAIHVYHFFCGDVGFVDVDNPVPKFSLKTMFYALDEVLNGNSKLAKSLPPLITHLFVTTLRMLMTQSHDEDEEDADLEPVELRLHEDLSKLREGLNAVSWSQICFFYMNLMDRYYTSDVSLEEGVLPGEGKLEMSYFWDKDQMDEEGTETESTKECGEGVLPGYNAYLGDPQGVLMKAYRKLQNQNEPWTLKADELMALLRTLTDDVLAKRPDLAEDITGRGDKLYELSKAKRAAVVKYNKVRLAHEGPKKPSRPKKSEGNEDKADNKNEEEQVDAESKEEDEKPFVPTATKQQFAAAEKAKTKADEAYENGLNKLISRTEPVGFDRNFNAIYFFRHDPTMLHIEQLKHSSVPSEMKGLGAEMIPFSSWHCIDTKPLFEQFLESLDSRGQREDELFKMCSSLTVLKRRLQDERKENTRAVAREREKEELERRLQNAKNACDAEDGRRSGRLASMAQDEFKKVEEEILQMAKVHEIEERQEKQGREMASDYTLLTGLQMVTDLFAGQRSTRSNKNQGSDDQNEAALLANTPSHKLWTDERIGGNGTLQILVENLLSLEDKCNDLSPWAREDMTRMAWRKQLSDASCAWAIDCVLQLGPPVDEEDSNEGNAQTSPFKKQKVDPVSLSSIVTTVKLCLKDLEMRIFDVSGKKKAIEEADTPVDEDEDAVSEEEDNEELIKRQNSWKIKINALKRIATHRYGLTRDIIVAAITVARKSHLNQVAAELKTALQMLRPQSAGEAKMAAIKVLEKFGGYGGSGDEDEEVDFNELANAGDTTVKKDDEGAEIASMLCDEVIMMSGSVGGDNFADKSDWSDAIRDCKSVSRLAAILHIFLSKADHTLNKLKEERSLLDSILGLNAKRTSRSKSAIRKHDSSISIWCNAKLTDKLIKARVTGFPWWPAHVCAPLDSVVAAALKGSGYGLVSSVGSADMYLVAEKDMIGFTDDTDEDLSQYEKATLIELHESVAIAKKLWRLRNRGVASPWIKKSRPRITEEKKSAN